MTLKTYDHVIDPAIRAVLLGETNHDAITLALALTREHLADDMLDPGMLDDTVLYARMDAYNDADFAWNVDGDTAACVDALREFWG